MTVEEFIKLIVENSGMVGIAIFAIHMLNRSWTLRLEESREYAEGLKEMNREMRNVIERNTKAFVRMMERIAK